MSAHKKQIRQHFRNDVLNGGYVKENGISLCPQCHIKAEAYHRTGTTLPGFSPDDLFNMIGSSYGNIIKESAEKAIMMDLTETNSMLQYIRSQ